MVAQMWSIWHKMSFIRATHWCLWLRIGFMIAQMCYICHSDVFIRAKHGFVCLKFALSLLNCLCEQHMGLCASEWLYSWPNVQYMVLRRLYYSSTFYGSEWALWLTDCGLVCTKKASLEQHMGVCGSERALCLPKCGLVCTTRASVEQYKGLFGSE